MATDEEVQAARESVQELRQKAAEAEAERQGEVAERTNEIKLARLKAEQERLQTQISGEAPTPEEDEAPSPSAATDRGGQPLRPASGSTTPTPPSPRREPEDSAE